MPEPDFKVKSSNITGSGYDDPSGAWPRKEYFGSSSINYAATGAKRNDLTLFAVSPNVDFELNSPTESQYPLNQVQETVSGHVIEIDDTPGNERVLIKHNTGGGIELRNDGSVIITSKLHKIESIGGDNKVIIQGEADLVYKGNLNISVTGDYNVDVKGDYNVSVGGNRTTKVVGADRRTINGNVGDIIAGGLSQTITGQVTNTMLGGQSNNIKGTYSNNVEGAVNIVASGAMTLTSELQTFISSPDMNIAAQSMTVIGNTGTIGGETITHYGRNYYGLSSTFTAGVTAPTFHGDLDGTATTSTVTQSQTYGEASQGSAGSITNTATSPLKTAQPTYYNLAEYLGKSAGGIRTVKIDHGDFIKNFIIKTVETGGVSATPITATAVARSKMRDPANRANSVFMSNLIASQTVSPEFSTPTPTGIGRIVKGGNSPEQGVTSLGPTTSSSTLYIPNPGPLTIIPEFEYNPYFAGAISSKTKLAPGITIAKFLGTDDPTNFGFVRDGNARVEIARYYYLHAQILKAMQDDDNKFKNFNLVVSEGLYRPGPSEVITPGSINDLKLKGRAVVYNLVNQSGVPSPTAMFDLSVYWKTKINYDKMILSYDTIGTELACRLIVIMPELDDEWKGTYRRLVETEFNNNKLTQGDLVEVLSFNNTAADAVSFPPVSDNQWYSFKEGIDKRVDPSLLAKIALIAEEFGQQLLITDGYRQPGTSATSRGVGKTSQHALGQAVDVRAKGFSKADILRLTKIASSRGVGGIGIYADKATREIPLSMHFDNRTSRVGWGHDYHFPTLPDWAKPTVNQHIAGLFVNKKIT